MLNGIYAERRKQTLNAECGYTECLYGECHYAECLYVECRYTECCSAKKSCKPYTINPLFLYSLPSCEKPFVRYLKCFKESIVN